MQETTLSPNNLPERNYGIELLRVTATFMIVIFHIFLHGGVLSANSSVMTNKTAWLIDIAVYSCVDIYALISGYVGYTSKFRLSKILSLQLQTSFWALLIVAVFKFCPPVTPKNPMVFKNWFDAVFPFMTGLYWYITSYFAILLLKPFLDAAVKNVPEKLFYISLAGIFLYLICMPILKNYFNPVYISLDKGFNAAWLIILYVIGGCFKRFEITKKINGWLAFILYFVLVYITWFAKFKLDIHTLVLYTSPTIFLSALLMLSAFSGIKIKNGFLKKLITTVSATTLGIYLIHDNPIIRENFIVNTFAPLAQLNYIKMTLYVLLYSVAIFTACFALETVRIKLFKLLKIDALVKSTDKPIDRWLSK